jgi:hypothetical protein
MKGIYDITGLAQERKLCSILYVRSHAEVLYCTKEFLHEMSLEHYMKGFTRNR